MWRRAIPDARSFATAQLGSEESAGSGRCEIGSPEPDGVFGSDDCIETVANSGRVEYGTRRCCEGLPAVVAVPQQCAAAAGVAEEDSGPVAR